MNLKVKKKEKDRAGVIELSGEVDLHTAPVFKEALYELVEAGRDQIIVDLDGLEFMDSSGLGVLLGALRRIKTSGGNLHLVCTRENILKIFEVTGLDKVFLIYRSVDECKIE